MCKLSHDSVKILKQLNQSKTLPYSLFENKDKYIEELYAFKFISIDSETIFGKDLSDIHEEFKKINIEPAGEAYISELKKSNIRFRLPLALSIIAIVISIAAIVLSPFFNAYFTKVFGL